MTLMLLDVRCAASATVMVTPAGVFVACSCTLDAAGIAARQEWLTMGDRRALDEMMALFCVRV